MNKTDRAKGQPLLAQIQIIYNRQDSILKIATEQHAVLGNLMNQLAAMYQEEKKDAKK